MTTTRTIRAYELRKGDVFIMDGYEYKVRSNTAGRIVFLRPESRSINDMGSKSQRIVQLIITVPGSYAGVKHI